MMTLVIKEVVALANTQGGYLFLGVEDNGKITGCGKHDNQTIMESIYDRSRPSIYTEVFDVTFGDEVVIVVKVEKGNVVHSTTAGEIYKRLGKNSKPYYPENISFSIHDIKELITPQRLLKKVLAKILTY